MNNTFKQMTKDGTIKRADASRIKHADIHVEPGFNLRTIDADFENELQSLVDHIARGGKVPALEVRPREEGGVWLVDGHRRHMAFGKLIAAGQPIEWIAVEQFVGNDMDRIARIMTSNEGAKLKPLEIAEGYRRLMAMGLSADDIGRRVCKTRQHVDQMMLLATAPHAVQQMVAAGTVKPTTAIDQVRKHGEGAAEVLKEAAKQGKVTAGALKPWTPPAKVIAPVVTAVESFLASLGIEERIIIEGAAGPDARVDETVTVSAKELLDVFKAFNGIGEARHAAANKAMVKQAKAAQGNLPE